MGNIYHEWNGTVLTITSDSGTSSADLVGEKGDTGIRGPQGPAGDVVGIQGPQGEPGLDGADGYTPQRGTDYWTDSDKQEIIQETKNAIPFTDYIKTVNGVAPDENGNVSVIETESAPSPNIVNINDTESWPFGTSETEAVKGIYSWVDSEGYINIKGTATELCTIMLVLDTDKTTFEPGTYYIQFDDVLKTGTQNVTSKFVLSSTTYLSGGNKPSYMETITEAVETNQVTVNFTAGAVVDFRGHCWVTKDKPFDYYAPKSETIQIPITAAKKEDLEALNDLNIISIFDSIGGVGDSMMSGHIDYKGTPAPTPDEINCYKKSWLSQLGKQTNTEVKHYSYSGATCKNWLSNQSNRYTEILETPHEAYFLAIGTNDMRDWAGYDRGTVADVGTDTASFYGYYSKVIARIREASPNSIIFMFSMYWKETDDYSSAIEEICNLTEKAYFVDISDVEEKFSIHRQGYHFNAIGYYYIANYIIEKVSKIIVDNYSDFNNLGY